MCMMQTLYYSCQVKLNDASSDKANVYQINNQRRFLVPVFHLSLKDNFTIVHLPVPKINSPGGADTASGEYTELRSVA